MKKLGIALIAIIILLFFYFPIKTSSVEIPHTQPQVQATEPVKEIVYVPRPELTLNTAIEYKILQEEHLILEEIERCNKYLSELQMHLSTHPVQVNIETIRILEIIEQYKQDINDIHRIVINVPANYNSRDFKSYEDYRAITAKKSPHYKLQNSYAYTDETGIRKVDDRYCIALGSYFTTVIGQYVDVVLANGTIIPCILGDQKANAHTDALNIAHITDGSIVEFIVEKEMLNDIPKKMGNLSYLCKEWQSPVIQIIVYDTNYLAEDYNNNIFW